MSEPGDQAAYSLKRRSAALTSMTALYGGLLKEKVIMNAAITTVIAAGIAVIGTLLAPILAQRASARTKAQEYEFELKRHQEDLEAEKRLREFTELRSTYTDLNTQMRNFLRALNNYLHLIRSGQCNDEARSSLEVVRHEYHQHYSDAQMIVSDNILSAAGHANGTLMRLYGAARRLDDFPVADLSTDVTEDEKETIESAFVLLGQARNRIAHVRNIMRKELGVTQADNKSDATAMSPSEMLKHLASTSPNKSLRPVNNKLKSVAKIEGSGHLWTRKCPTARHSHRHVR